MAVWLTQWADENLEGLWPDCLPAPPAPPLTEREGKWGSQSERRVSRHRRLPPAPPPAQARVSSAADVWSLESSMPPCLLDSLGDVECLSQLVRKESWGTCCSPSSWLCFKYARHQSPLEFWREFSFPHSSDPSFFVSLLKYQLLTETFPDYLG